MNFKRWLILLSLLVVAFPSKSFSAASPFEVTIQPKRDVYSLRENLKADGWKEEGGFRVNFVVKNISLSKQEFGYWSCSYYDNWTTSNNQVTLRAWECNKNIVSPKVLEPGESFIGEVPIQVVAGQAGKEMVFKLAFVPYKKSNALPGKNKPLGRFWSNEIKIKVVE